MSKNTQPNNHDDILLTWARSNDHKDMLLAWMSSHVISNWNTPYAVTLRLKKGATRDDAESNVVDFLKRLNRKVFKNAYIRYGKRLRTISKVEWGWENVEKEQSNRDPHIHMALESPTHLSDTEFQLLARKQWEETKQGISKLIYDNNKGKRKFKGNERIPPQWVTIDMFHMEKMYSSKWLDYISKKRTTLSGDDVLVRAWTL